jgi:hypothetical protein
LSENCPKIFRRFCPKIIRIFCLKRFPTKFLYWIDGQNRKTSHKIISQLWTIFCISKHLIF